MTPSINEDLFKRRIIEYVNKFGPMEGKDLIERINLKRKSAIKTQVIYRLAHELELEGKISARIFLAENFYYDRTNKFQVMTVNTITQNQEITKTY